MLENDTSTTETSTTDSGESPDGSAGGTTARPRRRRAASRPAGPPAPASTVTEPAAASAAASSAPSTSGEAAGDAPPAAKKTRKRASKKTAATSAAAAPDTADPADSADTAGTDAPVDQEAPARRTRKRAAKKSAGGATAAPLGGDATADDDSSATDGDQSAVVAPGVLFQPPVDDAPPRRRRAAAKSAAPDKASDGDGSEATDEDDAAAADGAGSTVESDEAEGDGTRRRRRRGGRGRRGRSKSDDEANGDADSGDGQAAGDKAGTAAPGDEEQPEDEGDGTRRRRRRRRRSGSDSGEEGASGPDDPPNTVVRVRESRSRNRSRDKSEDDDGVRSVKGSTRLEAKKQRRREGREAGRKRPSVITEAEFLARRESVDRSMIVRQDGARTQIAVLEDDVLVEHYVSMTANSGLVGNVYLGKVQNVLPSMEAAFVDIGRGRNAVLYAGEVNWDAAGLEGQPRRIELALKSGDSVLVQVTKEPIGHKGSRLTSQISLAGRFLVYVPGGSMTGISRKLPETERARLKAILKKVVPEGAGVIVRTAAEGASEESLARDVARLTAQWEDIEKKSTKASAPELLYSEPDLTIRVVRDIFNEDFAKLEVSGDEAWDVLEPYVGHVAPDLRDRMVRWTSEQDVFTAQRIDEQLTKALDRKVWLPSGGYLIIDRTEAMIVVDVNTGKFTGQGGNLEETVTKNNLEAAEEIVRQLRLRDLGGIIVIDFIDMVLESNRDLVLRRLLECLGRDRTKHQVAEVTSLGLVQMTRKRIGQGLHEAFSETCETCNGRGYHISTDPVQAKPSGGSERGNGAGRDSKGRGGPKPAKPSKKSAAAAKSASPVPDAADGEVPAADAAADDSPAVAEAGGS